MRSFFSIRFIGLALLLFVAAGVTATPAQCADAEAKPQLELQPHDRIALVGNGLAERMRLYGNFEALLHTRFPEHELVVRNFGWPADEVGNQQRPNDYTAIDDPLAVFAPNVILAFFGYNESYAGPEGLPKFKEDLAAWVKRTREEFTKDGKAPRIVLVSPIAYEATGNPLMPNGKKENENLKLYADAMAEFAKAQKMPFVDLFNLTHRATSPSTESKLTTNGVHINEAGDILVANGLIAALFSVESEPEWSPEEYEKIGQQLMDLKEAIIDLQWHHQQDYRMVNGWYVYGSRSKPLDVETFPAEYAKIRKMCADRDKVVWALAQGKTPPVPDDLNPVLAIPPTAFGTKPYSEPEELRILTPDEALKQMKVPEGYKIQTFASEEDFPELAKPVQMAFDNKGRLWAACMPSYPQWKPGDPKPNDKLIIFEDTDGDGKADKSTVFADGLHVPVGFELWNGGALVVSQPKLLFLKDTDGDDKADVREVVLDGFATDDTHHAISAFEWTPDGRLVMLEGLALSGTVETAYGPLRNKDKSVSYTYDPRTQKLEKYIYPCLVNAWCFTHNDWGQPFLGDGTVADQHWATPLTGAEYDARGNNREFIHYEGGTMRPALGNGFLFSRHFPESSQGNFFYACVINMNGILQFNVKDDGAGYDGRRVEDLVTSTDRNFRPGDPQIGPDGALYFVDWHNPLIGHMQYSQRDPNRDHSHGRIYRIHAEGRPLVTPVIQAGKTVPELLEQLREYEASTKYRVQRELRDRPKDEVVAAVKTWVASIDPQDPEHDRLLVDAMWALSGQKVVDVELVKQILASPTPDARAAAAHIIADLRDYNPQAFELLVPLVDDPHPRVRLEAIRGLSFFPTPESVTAVLGTFQHPLDSELTFSLESTLGALRPVWEQARQQGHDLAADNPTAAAFLDRVAAGNDRGREVTSLVKSIVQHYDKDGHRTTLTARLNGLEGNPDEGVKVFKRACQACHRVGGEGSEFGPNLSDVGKRLRSEEILESILFPNKKLDPKYRATNVLTVDGKAYSGLVVGENEDELSLLVGQGTLQKIPQDQIDHREEVEVSSMPEHLHEGLSGIEFLDLLKFLAAQQTAPTPPAETSAAGSGGQ
ncbi:PVC-type heme-binding CxxCH protein [Lacipirellula limnantheis]|uniref:Cytochrome c n=1 Tax=Lacipirellula limnantheis TaxID=2528024 RepID=A0A517TR63_9BACT|nr:PVC-type heme-binding CxxCH protein [Lacipirellula limnantheis]QDT70862.1 Cytochrome c [Lacipirellula limnantheis]